MPNKPTTLRESSLREEWERQQYISNIKLDEKGTADWWLDKFSTHSTELVSKIEGILEEEPINLDPTSNYINKNLNDIKRKIKFIINQEN